MCPSYVIYGFVIVRIFSADVVSQQAIRRSLPIRTPEEHENEKSIICQHNIYHTSFPRPTWSIRINLTGEQLSQSHMRSKRSDE